MDDNRGVRIARLIVTSVTAACYLGIAAQAASAAVAGTANTPWG